MGWIRLCRPTLTPDMATALTALSEALEEDEQVEVVGVKGVEGVFCAGLDLSQEKKGLEAILEIEERFGRLSCVSALASLTKPTLAALDGDALGVGLEVAMACDLRLSVPEARLGLTQIHQGLLPFCGGTQRLPRLVGAAKALELIWTGEVINGREAERLGLINRLFEKEVFWQKVEEFVEDLLAKGPIALRLGKEAVLKSLDLTLDQGIRLEEDLYVLLQTTQDRAEGIQSFLRKRPPRFVGK